MAQLPIEIVCLGDVPRTDVSLAMRAANACQQDFVYQWLNGPLADRLAVRAYRTIDVDSFLTGVQCGRGEVGGYHPYLIAIVDALLVGKTHLNLFGTHRAGHGVAVFTVAHVRDILIEKTVGLSAYCAYFLARYTLSFLAPTINTHCDTRRCVLDEKTRKVDLRVSMKRRSLCDDCRKAFLAQPATTPQELASLEKIMEMVETLLKGAPAMDKPRAFIGSSREGIDVANKLQLMLQHDISSVVWNQGATFGLGVGTLEALEKAVENYSCGIFVFTPDDELSSRGSRKPVARDNVVFEVGLFMGRLGRKRVFVVKPKGAAVALPSDFAGVGVAEYYQDAPNLDAALGPVCEMIRAALKGDADRT